MNNFANRFNQSMVSTEYVNYTDVALLQLIAQRDVRAYEALISRHALAVNNLLTRIVNDRAAADELLQEVFWQVWKDAAQFQGRGVAAAWLLRIARNRGIDHQRRQKTRPQLLPANIDTIQQGLSQIQPSLENQVEQHWNRQQVQSALEAIPHDQSECLQLAYFEGMNQREIAEHFGVPVGTIKSRIRIGMKKLERHLRAVGFS